VLAEERRTEIHSLKVARNPTCLMMSIRNGHDTVSNARDISTFRRSDECLLV
jgi:hypothetical protein